IARCRAIPRPEQRLAKLIQALRQAVLVAKLAPDCNALLERALRLDRLATGPMYHAKPILGRRNVDAIGQIAAERQSLLKQLLCFVIGALRIGDAAQKVERKCERPGVAHRPAQPEALAQQTVRLGILAL